MEHLRGVVERITYQNEEKTGDGTSDAIYQNWYKEVYIPDVAASSDTGSQESGADTGSTESTTNAEG